MSYQFSVFSYQLLRAEVQGTQSIHLPLLSETLFPSRRSAGAQRPAGELYGPRDGLQVFGDIGYTSWAVTGWVRSIRTIR